MIPRYRAREISDIWSDKNKLNLWQETELAVIRARVILGHINIHVYEDISNILRKNPIDIT